MSTFIKKLIGATTMLALVASFTPMSALADGPLVLTITPSTQSVEGGGTATFNYTITGGIAPSNFVGASAESGELAEALGMSSAASGAGTGTITFTTGPEDIRTEPYTLVLEAADSEAVSEEADVEVTTATITLTVTAPTVEVVDGPSLEAAVASAEEGTTIHLANGTYNLSSTLNITTNNLTLVGESEEGVVINSAPSGYGIAPTANGVTLEKFTLNGPASNYGVKAYQAENLTLRDVTVQGSGKSEIDLNAVTNSALESVTANGLSTAGVGIALSNVTDLELSNVTTLDNNWGGVGIFDYGTGPTTNVAFSGGDFAESNPIYSDTEHGFAPSGIELPSGFNYGITNAAHRGAESTRFVYFQNSESTAVAGALALQTAPFAANTVSVIREVSNTGELEDNFIVGPGMTIQSTLSAASAGGNVTVLAGTYNENLTIASDITITGESDAQINGQITINHSGVTLEDLTLSNPTGTKAVLINGVGDITISSNHFTQIGSDASVNANVHALYFQDGAESVDNIVVEDNEFDAIGHVNGRSASAISIGDSTGASDVNGVRIESNNIHGIVAKSSTNFAGGGRGAYGILVNHADQTGANIGSTRDLEILDNEINDLEGLWVHAIGLEGNTPDAVVNGNTISDLREHKLALEGSLDGFVVFFEKNPSAGSVAINENSFDLGTAVGVGMHSSLIGAYTIDATNNFWGDANPLESVVATDGSTIVVSPWFAEEDGDSVAIVITEEESTASSNGFTVNVSIPTGTIITGEDWDGDTSDLEASAVDVTELDSIAIEGFENISPVSAISIGSSDNSLTLSSAARLEFVGLAGRLIGWTTDNDGGDFTPITTECSLDDQVTVDAQLSTTGDCYIAVGSDLIVWTKHFTTFVAYTATVTDSSSTGSAGGGTSRASGRSGSGTANTTTTAGTSGTVGGGQVLGAAIFNFTSDLTIGSTGLEVNELQTMLIASGDLMIAAPTGYFGPLTKVALTKWQARNGVVATGYFGPLTRAKIQEMGGVPAMQTLNAAAREALILELKAKVLELQQELNQLNGA